MENIKVALCLSGQIRDWKKSYGSINEQIIKKYNADVFIHTWNIKGIQVPHNDNISYSDNYDKVDYEFLNFYSPKKILIDWPEYDNFKSRVNHFRFYNTIMMWHSIYNSHQLCKQYQFENKIKYDVIIRCRFDLFLKNFEIQDLESDTIYLPPNENMDIPFTKEMKAMLVEQGPKYMPNDQLAYGSTESMDYYCEVYKTILTDTKRYPLHPEALLTMHLWNDNHTNFKIEVNDSILMKINR